MKRENLLIDNIIIIVVKDFEKDRVKSVLQTVFEMNVMRFGQGQFGAVNGMTSSGHLEIVSMQSEEIWTGVTYGLTSTMIMEVEIESQQKKQFHHKFLFRILSKRASLHLKVFIILATM